MLLTGHSCFESRPCIPRNCEGPHEFHCPTTAQYCLRPIPVPTPMQHTFALAALLYIEAGFPFRSSDDILVKFNRSAGSAPTRRQHECTRNKALLSGTAFMPFFLTDATAPCRREHQKKKSPGSPVQTAHKMAKFIHPKFAESVQCCAVLCCAVLCCAVLCCAVLCCAVLCCAVLCCAVLCCAVLCCAVLCCAVLCCAVLCCAVQCSAVLCCAVLCCAVLCCAVLCCAVLCCAVLCCAVLCCAVLCCAVLCCAVLCCAVLCCAVLCCAVLCCAVLRCAVPCYVQCCTGHVATFPQTLRQHKIVGTE